MNNSRVSLVARYRSTSVYVPPSGARARARAEVGVRETTSVKVRAGVPLPSMEASKVPPVSSSLPIGKKLQQGLWQVCGPPLLIG